MADAATLRVGKEPTPDRDVLLQLYVLMRRIESLDVAIGRALSSGSLATAYYPVRGLEAVCACLGVLLRPEDYLVSTYRCVGDVIAKGVQIREVLAEMNGRAGGTSKGKGGTMHMSDPTRGLMATTGIVGGGLPIANGLALAAAIKGEPRVTAVTFGDGATSIGAFHESLHLAALWKLPVVFVCQNNQWGEHTPLHAYTSVPHLAERASAYGIESVAVDGFNTLETFSALRLAVEHARAGSGPAFVECITYRLGPHAFGNDESYMPAQEKQAALEQAPLPSFRNSLIERGIGSSDELDTLDLSIAKEIEEAFQYAQSSPPTPDDELLRDVFADDGMMVRL